MTPNVLAPSMFEERCNIQTNPTTEDTICYLVFYNVRFVTCKGLLSELMEILMSNFNH